MRPVEQTATSIAPSRSPVGQRFRHCLGGRVGVSETAGAGARIGAAGVEDDRAQVVRLEDLLAPQDRRCLDLVRVNTAAAAYSGPSLKTVPGRGCRWP